MINARMAIIFIINVIHLLINYSVFIVHSDEELLIEITMFIELVEDGVEKPKE